jgi:polysaccharide export outer membrane protein
MNKFAAVVCSTIVIVVHGAALSQIRETLLIGPGDAVHVQVLNTPEFDETGRVTDAGMLRLIAAGEVKLSGLSPAEAALLIEKSYVTAQIMRHPAVLVTVAEYATQKVKILGEVEHPGEFSIMTTQSVLEVLALAGGLTPLSSREVFIQRKGSFDKAKYFLSNNPDIAADTAINVHPGDSVLVPRAGVAYVLGDVHSPGGYTLTNNEGHLSVLELLARAGGIDHTAKANHATLLHKTDHGYVLETLALTDMQEGKVSDRQITSDDVVYVPFSYIKNFFINGTNIAASVGSAAVYRF